MLSLGGSFFLIALIYATVGFGGGSSYLALLSVSDIPFEYMPKISLICNLLVVSGGCYHYWRANCFNWSLISPFILSSVPASFLGGFYPIKEEAFLMLLFTTLLVSGVRILFIKTRSGAAHRTPSFQVSFILGSLIGFLSGVVGIGGGIFLSPLMLNFGWARPKEVAALASAFIFLNSLSGLLGQFAKNSDLGQVGDYFFLFPIVIIGGQIGSRIGSHAYISDQVIRKATGLLILVVSLRLLLKLLHII